MSGRIRDNGRLEGREVQAVKGAGEKVLEDRKWCVNS